MIFISSFPIERQLQISGFHTFFAQRYAPDFYFKGEHHPFWELVYCLDGTAGVSADERIYRLRPGDLILHKPMEHHRIWSEEGSRPHVMIFSFDGEGALLEQLAGAWSCTSPLQSYWNELFVRLRPQQSSYLNDLSCRPVELQIVAGLCENGLLMLASEGRTLGFNQSKSARDYERVVQMMRGHLAKPLTVEELCWRCGVSATTVKELFRRFNSMGVHAYYLHLRLNEAVRLLDEGKTVTETAELLGFSSQSYFSTVFKRELHENPMRFKRTDQRSR